jgi:hypothetical protein
MNQGKAHGLASRKQALALWLEITQKESLRIQGSIDREFIGFIQEFRNYRIQISTSQVLTSLKRKWHTKANRCELVLAKVFHTIQYNLFYWPTAPGMRLIPMRFF